MKGIGKTIKRRRREAKTDYLARLSLLRSDKPRLVVRKTNRYLLAQIVSSDVAKDKVIVSASSKELLGQGWPEALHGSLKSLAAGYLTGMLLAKKAKDVPEAVLDIGLQRNAKKGRIYSVLRGASDGGLAVAHGPEAVPDEKKLEHNQKTREIFIKMKEAMKHGRK